ncbi:phage replication protein O, N-terminal domain [[Pasteurella] mairii]|uniref:Phage replication protein O, N-terminal domain n=1 Tax=[Pasteurella] mairii TaxID=757 RepID=A0A379B5L7_9PAST|nr:phage replication protein O, N-terminal domain [[Pasteurella] mairii]
MSDNHFIPNSFQVPNAVIDELMSQMNGAELKCYLAILRKTKGWNKEFDAISVTQLMEVTGLSNRSVIDACNALVSYGLLNQTSGSRGVKIFSVNLCKKFTSEKSSPVKKVHGTSEKSSPVTSEKSSHTKNNIKNTIQNTNTNLAVSNTRARKIDPENCDLPDYVDRNSWVAYCKMRKAKGKNSEIRTQETINLCLKNLERFSGGDPRLATAILEQSIGNTWTGLFELKQPMNKHQAQKPSAHSGFNDRDYGEQIIPDWARESVE